MTDYNWEQHIAVLAYYKWEAAGRPEGRDADFWFEALEDYRAMIQSQGTNGPFPGFGE